MDIDWLRKFCLSLPATSEDIKWGNDLCFLVVDKMFCVAGLEPPFKVTFKVSDEEFETLSISPGFIPAPYMARAKWVMVTDATLLNKKQWEQYIRRSYELVIAKLTKKSGKKKDWINIMKAFNLIAAILFVLSAVLQYNDPDPYLWIPIYLFGAVLCWMAFRGKYYPTFYLGGIIFYTVYAVYLFFEKDGVADWLQHHQAENIVGTMKAENPWIEATREFFGLVILIVVLLVDYFYTKRKSHQLDT